MGSLLSNISNTFTTKNKTRRYHKGCAHPHPSCSPTRLKTKQRNTKLESTWLKWGKEGCSFLVFIQTWEEMIGTVVHEPSFSICTWVELLVQVFLERCFSAWPLYSLLCRLAGQVGYIVTGMRKTQEALIGDTFCNPDQIVSPLPGFRRPKPMVRTLFIITFW